MTTIAENITRIQQAKANIKAAIEEKGVEVGQGTIDTYAAKIAQIPSGGGGTFNIYRVSTIAERNTLTPNENDICVVYRDTTKPMTNPLLANSTFVMNDTMVMQMPYVFGPDDSASLSFTDMTGQTPNSTFANVYYDFDENYYDASIDINVGEQYNSFYYKSTDGLNWTLYNGTPKTIVMPNELVPIDEQEYENYGYLVAMTPIKDFEFETYIYTNNNWKGIGDDFKTLDGISSLLSDFVNKYRFVPQTYPTITNDAVTLYTPNDIYRSYVIGKTMAGSYRIGWVNTNLLLATNSDTTGDASKLAFAITDTTISIGTTYYNWYRGSSQYETLEQAIDALKNPNTSYNFESFGIPLYDTAPYYLTSTNTTLLRKTGEIVQSRKISSNETIEYI